MHFLSAKIGFLVKKYIRISLVSIFQGFRLPVLAKLKQEDEIPRKWKPDLFLCIFWQGFRFSHLQSAYGNTKGVKRLFLFIYIYHHEYGIPRKYKLDLFLCIFWPGIQFLHLQSAYGNTKGVKRLLYIYTTNHCNANDPQKIQVTTMPTFKCNSTNCQ